MFNNAYEINNDDVYIIMIDRKGVTRKTIIDHEDLERIKDLGLSWYAAWNQKTKSYYAKGSTKRLDQNGVKKQQTFYLHREVMNAKGKVYIDHKNHDTLNNRKNNLRMSSNKQNSSNRTEANKNNKSGYRNVCWDESYRKWKVQLQIEGKNTILEMFDDVHEAGKFAKEMREKYYGEFAGNG